MNTEIALEIKNFSKKISKKTIIDNLSLTIYKGEVFGFLGPNGAGKTTTIKSIVGLSSIDSGKILINGYDIQKDYENAIKNVGAIVETPEFYTNLSGWHNLVISSRLYDNVTKQRIGDIVQLVGLRDRINEKVKTYSLGMKQRLGIAMAFIHKPLLVILDEPTNGLDPSGIHELRNYLRELAKKDNIAVVISSHILSEMQLLCDRVAIIDKGKLICVKNLIEDSPADNLQCFRFQVDMNSNIKKVIMSCSKEIEFIDLNEDGFTIKTYKNIIPEINKSLVDNNYNVYTINEIQKSLEEDYMDIIGG